MEEALSRRVWPHGLESRWRIADTCALSLALYATKLAPLAHGPLGCECRGVGRREDAYMRKEGRCDAVRHASRMIATSQHRLA